jgi:putative transposase
LPALKAERSSLAGVQSQVLQNVAVRIDLAFQAFFRRRAAAEVPGYPRFRGKGRYDSLTFPQVPVGCKLDVDAKRLRVMNVGLVKIILHRPLEGTHAQDGNPAPQQHGQVVRQLLVRMGRASAPASDGTPGRRIDVGLKTFAALSTGEAIANARFFRREVAALAKAQRRQSKAEKGTPERAARRKVVARVYERSAWRRGDFTHQHSRRIVNTFDLIAVEDLSVNRMMHTHCLAKGFSDAAWSQFAALLACKAAWAGRTFVAVNPAYASRDCSQCGHRQPLSLADRIYTCPCCGVVLDRDFNAGLNMLRLGQQSLASA